MTDRLTLHPLLQTIRGYCTDEVPHVVLDGLLSSAVGRAKLLEAEIERLTQELRIARFDADVPVRELREEVERLEGTIRLLLWYADNGWDMRAGHGEALAEARFLVPRALDEGDADGR